MTPLGWVLAPIAVAMWIGIFIWYFWGEIRNFWPSRYDKWFRGD